MTNINQFVRGNKPPVVLETVNISELVEGYQPTSFNFGRLGTRDYLFLSKDNGHMSISISPKIDDVDGTPQEMIAKLVKDYPNVYVSRTDIHGVALPKGPALTFAPKSGQFSKPIPFASIAKLFQTGNKSTADAIVGK